MRSSSRYAFTLLEISMVMVVVGLLIAGIIVGRSMIEAAALQSVVADFEKYRQLAIAYRDKYGELPGDHSGATSIASADAGCAANPAASNTMTTATCNGDGNGMIGDSTGDPLATFSNYKESLLFWQHLSNEGLLTERYNGRRSTASNEITFGVNVPVSKIASASFMIRYFPTDTASGNYYKANYGNVFFYGAPGASAADAFNTGALTPEQAKSIDAKIDDGRPGFGKVLTFPNSSPNCPTTTTESTAVYSGSVTTSSCALIFITGF